MKGIRKGAIFLVLALVAMQFIPIERSNPSSGGQFAAPPEVETTLRRACYDCHSNETHWPWYAGVAPISFFVWRDVAAGRKELNFSTWYSYDTRRKGRKLKEIVKEVKAADMPPWYYVPVHPDAKLSNTDRDAIIKWATQP